MRRGIGQIGSAVLAATLVATVLPNTAMAVDEGRIAKILASADGKTRETAYPVGAVSEEYDLLRALGFKPKEQALIVEGKKAFDVLTVIETRSGEDRKVWFDISSFFGHEFGL